MLYIFLTNTSQATKIRQCQIVNPNTQLRAESSSPSTLGLLNRLAPRIAPASLGGYQEDRPPSEPRRRPNRAKADLHMPGSTSRPPLAPASKNFDDGQVVRIDKAFKISSDNRRVRFSLPIRFTCHFVLSISLSGKA